MATVVEGGGKPIVEVRRDIESTLGCVPGWVDAIPKVALEGFWSLMKGFELGDTKIPNKYKELIGLGVAGATRCRYCALFHTEGARLNGATDEEIAEASLMAGLTMCASTFLNAEQVDYGRFRDETLKIVEYVRDAQASAPNVKTRDLSGLHA
jgi:AhpD family alkylhydroperoxidase